MIGKMGVDDFFAAGGDGASLEAAAIPFDLWAQGIEDEVEVGLVKELTDAQHQAAHTIAAMKAAEEDLRRHAPPPYWYSNPATLNFPIASPPQSAGFAPSSRRR